MDRTRPTQPRSEQEDMNRRTRRATRRWVPVIVAGVVLLGGLPLALSGSGSADGIAQFSFKPATIQASPGDTVAVDLRLRSTPQIANGAFKVGVVVTFNQTSVRVTDIQQGPFMHLKEETTVVTNISRVNNDEGFLVYDLHRRPPKGGVSGFSTFARITLEIKEDAPNGTSQLQVVNSRVLLTDGMPQQVLKAGAEITVVRDRPLETERQARSTPEGTSVREPSAKSDATEGNDPATPVDSGGEADGPGTVVGIAALVGAVGLFAGVLVLLRRL